MRGRLHGRGNALVSKFLYYYLNFETGLQSNYKYL